MKEKDDLKKDTVQMIRAAILQIEKDSGNQVDDNKIIEIRVRLMKHMNTIAPLVEVSTWGHSSGSGFYTKPDLKDLRTRLYQSILSYINQAHDAIYHHEQHDKPTGERVFCVYRHAKNRRNYWR